MPIGVRKRAKEVGQWEKASRQCRGDDCLGAPNVRMLHYLLAQREHLSRPSSGPWLLLEMLRGYRIR